MAFALYALLISIVYLHASNGKELCGDGFCSLRSAHQYRPPSCISWQRAMWGVANHSFADFSCQDLGFHLVAIETPEEQDFLVANLLNVTHWIGLTTDDRGNRVWSADASNVTYTNYGLDEAKFVADNDGGLCFMNCSYSYRYICERKSVCPNTTSTTPSSSPTSMVSTATTTVTTFTGKRANMGCTNFRLLASDSTLIDDLVRSSYTVSSVIGCAQRCLVHVTCSVFTFIRTERACLLGQMHHTSPASSYNERIGATTYLMV
eukprot:XP_011668306.1 PREDICTED: uncharacterized protein LOC105440159 [Strongylocentrotus purpuratus]